MFLIQLSDNNPINLFCDMQTYFSLSLLLSTCSPLLFTNALFMGKSTLMVRPFALLTSSEPEADMTHRNILTNTQQDFHQFVYL